MRALFFAHDRGGGNLLVSVAPHISRRGHACLYIGLGPSKDLFAHTGIASVQLNHRMLERELTKRIRRFGPDIVISGTSIASSAEHVLWRVAKSLDVPSLALVDGWTKIRERFRPKSGTSDAPDGYGVVDSHTKRALVRLCKVPRDKIGIIGHPHLEKSVADLVVARSARKKSDHLTVGFFSTPVENTEAGPGIDAASLVLPCLLARGPMDVLFKPHPREAIAPWRQWVDENRAREQSGSVRILLVEERSTHDMLANVDVAIGLPTTVLMEAAFSGIPVVILEPRWWPDKNHAMRYYLSNAIVRNDDYVCKKLSELIDRARVECVGVENGIVGRFMVGSCRRAVKKIMSFGRSIKCV
jgi:hypothetical protein